VSRKAEFFLGVQLSWNVLVAEMDVLAEKSVLYG
jgi:hypothetical protein